MQMTIASSNWFSEVSRGDNTRYNSLAVQVVYALCDDLLGVYLLQTSERFLSLPNAM